MGGRGGGGTARQQNITVGHLRGFMAVACRVQNNGRGSCGRGNTFCLVSEINTVSVATTPSRKRVYRSTSACIHQ